VGLPATTGRTSGDTWEGQVSDDGTAVSFQTSRALVADDTNGINDSYAREAAAAPANRPPTITNPGSQKTVEAEAASFTLSVSDPDGDPLTFSAVNLPAGFSINSSTGQIGGAAPASAVGTYWVTATVAHGALSASTTSRWDVRGAAKTGLWEWERQPAQGLLRTLPVYAASVTGIAALASGGYHSLALRSDGRVLAWGYNGNGQLGDGTTSPRPAPAEVSGLSGIRAIAAGGYHSLALRSDGRVLAWGNNFYGQLGDGTTIQRPLPTLVSGLSSINAMSAGWFHGVGFGTGVASTGRERTALAASGGATVTTDGENDGAGTEDQSRHRRPDRDVRHDARRGLGGH
jgi:hypothetical protein